MKRDAAVVNYATFLGEDYPTGAVGVHHIPPVHILPQGQNEYHCCGEHPR
jgi:hypothetical protein